MAEARLRAFISSRMEELEAERRTIVAALNELGLESFAFEDDAGARPESIQATYLEEAGSADLYIGVFWKGYGPRTIEEFEHAQVMGMDCLIYEKGTGPGAPRDRELQAFLDRLSDVEQGLTIRRFDCAEELSAHLKADLARWQTRNVPKARGDRQPPLFEGVPSGRPTSIVGRGEQIRCIARLLRAGRDVAIDGLAGVGKTTLALALVYHAGMRRQFPDGVLWAGLGPNADLASTLARWGTALQRAGLLRDDVAALATLPERAEAIHEAIGAKQMLLVLDDVWEPNAAEVLRCGGPHCCHLITTRDKRIASRFRPAVDAQYLPTLGKRDARQLLRTLAPEACKARPDAAGRLLEAVGGLPQAIRTVGGYLSAADGSLYADLFPDLGAEAFAEMEDAAHRLRQPAERLGSFPDRSITLQETVALSLETLPQATREAFYRLGAFAPKPLSFGVDAARAVTQADAKSLAQLAARNLVDVDPVNRELALHPTLADVACTGLDEESVRRHREHYLQLAKEQASNWQQLASIYGQIRWAWEQAPDDEGLFPFIGILEGYQARRGLIADALAWANRALKVAEQRNLAPAVAHLLTLVGRYHSRIGYRDQAQDCFQRSLRLWEQIGERDRQLESRQHLAFELARAGHPTRALTQLEEALALAVNTGNRRGEAECRLIVGLVQRNEGKLKQALAATTEALETYRQVGNRVGELEARGLLATVYRNLGQLDLALEQVRKAQTLAESLGRQQSAAEMGLVLGTVFDEQGQLVEAHAAAEAALEKAESTGDQSILAQALDQLGTSYLRLDQTEPAAKCFRRRLALEKASGNRHNEASVHLDLGWLHLRGGRLLRALGHYHRARKIYDELGDVAGRADALERMAFAHEAREEPQLERQCLQHSIELWESLGNQRRVAKVLCLVGDLEFRSDAPERGFAAYRQALQLYQVLDDSQGQATVLGAIASAYELQALAVNEHRLQAVENALTALDAALRLDPGNSHYEKRLQALRQRRDHARRFGDKILYGPRGVTPLALDIGAPAHGRAGDDAALGAKLSAMRQRLGSNLGLTPPPIRLRRREWLRPQEYVVQINEVPLAGVLVPEDASLCPEPPERLEDLELLVEAAVDPQTGRRASWVVGDQRQAIESAGFKLWQPDEVAVLCLEAVLRKNLWLLLGHQETMALLEKTLADRASLLRAEPPTLGLLVATLRTLLEEQVPITALRKIVATFIPLHQAGADRLAIVQALRLLPQLRPHLPGNDTRFALYRFDSEIEATIADHIQTVRSGPCLALEPEQTMKILSAIRSQVAHQLATADVALVVERAEIRRFARKLVELEFPSIPVLSRPELMPGRYRDIVKVIK